MKKSLFFAMVVTAIMASACGSKSQKDGAADENQKTTWQTYTNDNYGYSIEVPSNMTKKETLTEDTGTIFSLDGEEGITFNRIDITGGKDLYGEEYTPEKVKKDYEYWTENKEITNEKCGDDYFTFTVSGDNLTQTDYYIYHGDRYVIVTVCYDNEHEKQLGGEVADHVFSSIKFK